MLVALKKVLLQSHKSQIKAGLKEINSIASDQLKTVV